MQLTLDMLDGSPIPKRGDLIRTNIGNPRERTWMVLHVHSLKPTKGFPRCRLWAERWWHIDVELRMKLYRSAERNGGQRCIDSKRYPARRAKSFEDYMRPPQYKEGRSL